jgi:hypothetical protein
MMSEINDADRRLLVCVAVAMEPEPWGIEWGRGLQDPLALCGLALCSEEGSEEGAQGRDGSDSCTASPRQKQKGPGVSCTGG